MNKQNWNRLIDTENGLMVARGEGVWGTGEKGEEIKKHRLSCTTHEHRQQCGSQLGVGEQVGLGRGGEREEK